MSFRKERFLSYAGVGSNDKTSYLQNLSADELDSLFMEIMQNGIHGLCFSLYEDGQKPGDHISEAQIRRRIEIIKPYAKWVRSFSCIEGNEFIPIVAKEHGMKTLVGAWLGHDEEKNREEIDALIKLGKEGKVDVAAVGNEVLYRKDLNLEELLGYMREVKEALPDIPVGYVDAYYEFVRRPELTDMCDLILCNCYPYWEGTAIEHSFGHMRHMFDLCVHAGNGKRILITETGWPSQGEGLGGAMPSRENAMKYFINTQLWANDNDVEVFYFSSFDESWKVGAEGEVGAYWGLWDKHEKLKYGA
ncbi:Exo-beta-1,3-glucanase, GH17 family [Cyclonatronum proteinivorum]|uniref:Endo-1,3-beta-glucanase btgC n=1 Tax=Cyclonatronum proteinivorum TaxID=1457365 RepID=A0A345UJS9_9BACT|nr:glycosyl hydrolase family 17 protein [Cyclonatronum proteinivorum]AXJ00731.1 Exo-beta-1,3-glucanase, GH17 family [Cyclonatronum proteinivorum]